MSKLVLQAAAAFSLSAICGLSSGAELKPLEGKWAITSSLPAEQQAAMSKMPPEAVVQMRKQGMEINIKAGTLTVIQCLDSAKLQQWHKLGQDPNMKCDKPTIKQDGNMVTMDMRCSQPKAATMHSVITFNANRDQYQFEHQLKTEGKEMRIKGHANRIGACQ